MSVKGVWVALATPFDEDGDVNLKEARRLARHLVDEGVHGVVVGGTTAESPTLTHEEKAALLEALLEEVGDRVPVWFGAGTHSTWETLRLARLGEERGAHGLMLVTPYYNKPPQEGLYRHFRAVAEEASLPLMLYNVPGRTAVHLEPETVARLAEDCPTVVAVKEASGRLEMVTEIRRLAPRIAIMTGDDGHFLSTLRLGGHGVVSVAAQVAPRLMVECYEAFREGREGRAEELDTLLQPLYKALFVTTNPIPVKYALECLGYSMGGYRLPLVEPTEAQKEVIRQALSRAGLVKR
ncbi:MAG: 4-hydroxy-tetrahydrodipicolinate synthase [Clostridiales bacterium]|nr:4-hydroxy-tetrahydrodipicolinate synthase [Clostridiales bacterium]